MHHHGHGHHHGHHGHGHHHGHHRHHGHGFRPFGHHRTHHFDDHCHHHYRRPRGCGCLPFFAMIISALGIGVAMIMSIF